MTNLVADIVSLKSTTNIVLLSFLQLLITTQQACHAAWTTWLWQWKHYSALKLWALLIHRHSINPRRLRSSGTGVMSIWPCLDFLLLKWEVRPALLWWHRSQECMELPVLYRWFAVIANNQNIVFKHNSWSQYHFKKMVNFSCYHHI